MSWYGMVVPNILISWRALHTYSIDDDDDMTYFSDHSYNKLLLVLYSVATGMSYTDSPRLLIKV